ncbi:MAG: ferrochelatase [Parachlamydiaceae bacterium]|nr:ferrochelatase [Parachlamydiaceae bacterium]
MSKGGKIGILLVNLGTPDSPSGADVFRYLIEFLTDPRVIDTSWLTRQLLVRGAIVPFRFLQSARSYQAIWTPQGSPLKVYGYRVRELLQEKLGDDYCVELAMRYQNPSLEQGLNKLIENQVDQILVLPLFPHYASATTGSVHQKIMEIVSRYEVIPEIAFISDYGTHPKLIDAFSAVVADSFNVNDYDHVIFSFHGLPQRHILKADKHGCCLKTSDCCQKMSYKNKNCYSAQCYATAKALADACGISAEMHSVAFQSRLGRDPWLQPYFSETIETLAHQGKKKILVFCASFVCDCLETIHEIGVEYALEFKKAGGEQLDLVPGLNDHPKWIEALVEIVKEKTVGITCPTSLV